MSVVICSHQRRLQHRNASWWWKASFLDCPPLTSFSYPSLQSNRKENKGGYLCHSCAEQRIGPLAFLTASPEQVHSMERTVENIVLPRHEALLFLVFWKPGGAFCTVQNALCGLQLLEESQCGVGFSLTWDSEFTHRAEQFLRKTKPTRVGPAISPFPVGSPFPLPLLYKHQAGDVGIFFW